MTDPIQLLWCDAERDARAPTPDELRQRSRALYRATWRRDAIEYAAALLGAAVFTREALTTAHGVIQLGCALIVLGTGVVVAGLWRRRVRPAPDAMAEASTDFLRSRLVHQRDMLADVARWYLAPPLPGLAVYALGHWLALRERVPLGEATLVIGALVGFVAATFGAIWWWNRRAARRLDRDIAALDAGDTNC